jgi:hypothetical protein
MQLNQPLRGWFFYAGSATAELAPTGLRRHKNAPVGGATACGRFLVTPTTKITEGARQSARGNLAINSLIHLKDQYIQNSSFNCGYNEQIQVMYFKCLKQTPDN